MLKKVLAGVVLSTVAFSAGVMAQSVMMFADVSTDAWYSDGVMFSAEAGLMTGQGEGDNFDPAGNVNRAQLAVILERFDAYLDAKMEMEAEGETMTEEDTQEMMAIAGIVMADENFTTLEAAIEAAGLTATFEGETKYTVFAPTDAAFEALEAGTLDDLLADTEALAEVLKYHVVEGEVMASQVLEMDSATTLEGSDLMFSLEGEAVMVNEARVTQTDIMASNGVIHVIDAVLMPGM